MVIVTYRHRPKRPTKKPTQAATIKVPRIVEARAPGKRKRVEEPSDPEADARVAAFFARAISPPTQ